MKFSRLCALSLTALAFFATPTPNAHAEAQSDSRATAVAEKTLEAMGGQQAWDDTRFIRFEFFGFRLHHWDRYTGRHRLEGKTRDGDAYVVLLDLNSRTGKAWLNGEAVAGEELDKWLENAWSAWINDTYWLLMPYKLLDPGVHLTHDGEEVIGGKTYDKLKLTFDNVGLTPGDTYWAWINRDTGLMDQWAYVLQGWEEDRPATRWQWLDWQSYSGIMLSPKRNNPDGDRKAELGQIKIFDHLPDALFESPEPPAPGTDG